MPEQILFYVISSKFVKILVDQTWGYLKFAPENREGCFYLGIINWRYTIDAKQDLMLQGSALAVARRPGASRNSCRASRINYLVALLTCAAKSTCPTGNTGWSTCPILVLLKKHLVVVKLFIEQSPN